MSHSRVIVNVHIEKTGGTSLLKFFEHTVGKDRVASYDPVTDSLTRVSDLPFSPSNYFINKLQLQSYIFWPILKQTYFAMYAKKNYASVAKNHIAVVHGHFTANQFDKLFPDMLQTVVIRDPLKRMHSQYDHWKQAKGRSQWRVMIPYDDKMSFEEYAMLPELRNYQTQALAGRDLSTFELVGVTDQLTEYAKALYQLLISEGFITSTIPLPTIEKLKQHKNNYQIGKSHFEKDFAAFHKEDYELYRQAKSFKK